MAVESERTLDIRERPWRGEPGLVLSGRLDWSSSPALRRMLVGLIKKRPRRIAVDLSGLQHMDTSGLATLIEAEFALRAQGGKLVLTGVGPRVEEVLSSSRTKQLFLLAPDAQAPDDAKQ